MRRAAAMLALGLALAGGLGSGCASHKAAVREHDWQTYEPAGGWQAYIPPRRDYKPSPTRATAFGLSPQPSLFSVGPSGIAMPIVGH